MEENKSFKEKFDEAVANAQANGKIFGFEITDKNGESQFDYITYDEKTNTLSWQDISIEVEEDMDVDFNLDGLYDAILEDNEYIYIEEEENN